MRFGEKNAAASDLGLHCLPIVLLGVSRLQWVKVDSDFTVSTRRLRYIYATGYSSRACCVMFAAALAEKQGEMTTLNLRKCLI